MFSAAQVLRVQDPESTVIPLSPPAAHRDPAKVGRNAAGAHLSQAVTWTHLETPTLYATSVLAFAGPPPSTGPETCEARGTGSSGFAAGPRAASAPARHPRGATLPPTRERLIQVRPLPTVSIMAVPAQSSCSQEGSSGTRVTDATVMGSRDSCREIPGGDRLGVLGWWLGNGPSAELTFRKS